MVRKACSEAPMLLRNIDEWITVLFLVVFTHNIKLQFRRDPIFVRFASAHFQQFELQLP